MTEKSFCFYARVGSDRYRLALLTVFPQLLQLREISKRLGVLKRARTHFILSDGNTTIFSSSSIIAAGEVNSNKSINNGAAKGNEKIDVDAVNDTKSVSAATVNGAEKTVQNAAKEMMDGPKKDISETAILRSISQKYENAWNMTLEAAGVLSNSFAPYPSENCNNELSTEYRNLWSLCDVLFFQLLEKLKQCFEFYLKLLANIAADQNISDSSIDFFQEQQQADEICKLYRQTRQLESNDSRLKSTLIQSITLDLNGQTPIDLTFPNSSSRLIL